MMPDMKGILMTNLPTKAILVVSFGTSHKDTREKTIDRIEEDIRKACPDRILYRAWTSKMILKKLRTRDQLFIFNLKEAMDQMLLDGIRDVIVQPTHVINGIESEQLKEDVASYADDFDTIAFGAPLLTSDQDNREAIQAVMEEWQDLPQDEVLVLMGHGTTHRANEVYTALGDRIHEMGYSNVFLGTVEAYPSMEALLKQVREYAPKKVHLAPFMIVAGDHANHDMAGDDPASWRCQFEQAGFSVECHLKGLGEYEGIRKIFLRHVAECES
jgi:cobalamin biosynthesis Co2+ chelatase CbiK